MEQLYINRFGNEYFESIMNIDCVYEHFSMNTTFNLGNYSASQDGGKFYLDTYRWHTQIKKQFCTFVTVIYMWTLNL